MNKLTFLLSFLVAPLRQSAILFKSLDTNDTGNDDRIGLFLDWLAEACYSALNKIDIPLLPVSIITGSLAYTLSFRLRLVLMLAQTPLQVAAAKLAAQDEDNTGKDDQLAYILLYGSRFIDAVLTGSSIPEFSIPEPAELVKKKGRK
jgi:hypothetical protein